MRLSKVLATAIALTSFTAGDTKVAHADDTEIFIPPATAAAMQPNILFIMDTSGSMDTKVVIRKPYNPGKTYPGSCSTSRVYWRLPDDTRPECSTTGRWISKSNLRCKSAAETLDTKGTLLIGPLAQWDGSSSNANKRKWTALTRSRDSNVECKADMDIKHGLADSDGLVPADADADGYSDVPGNQISWSDPRDKSYTLYSGNYLNWRESESETEEKTRMEIVQETAVNTIEGLNNVNVALMRFSSNNEGGMVTHQMSPIATARTTIVDQIKQMSANGGTPLSETFFEAYRYLTGGAVKFGEGSTPTESVSASRTSMNGGNYIKPEFKACQQNIVVYLTDGDPTVDGSAHTDIKNVIGHDCTENGALGTEGGGASAGDGKCLDDLAGYMAAHDFYDDPALPNTGANPEPIENVRTYTIGFGTGVSERGLALLKKTAELGEGAFFEALDPESLKEALDNIVGDLQDQSVSFTSPTVSVNAFNRTQTLNDLFITVFQPETKVHWPGNLKKYRLLPDGTIMDASSPSIAAVDPATGFFAEDTQSYWSASPDQYFVPRGGAANKLKLPNARKVYTDAGWLADSKNDLLNIGSNWVVTGNGAISNEMLGLPASAATTEKDALINWLRGADVDDDDGDGKTVDETRFEMGDPLHSRPVSVIYGGSASSPDAVVFMATNDGYLHAINPQDGDEIWTFIPSELMPRAKQLREDPLSNTKSYGLDGNLTVYKSDADGDGTVETGDKVLLFFGMGRGGSNYYALDVTDRNAPKILWRNGASGTLGGLGQTWSTPVITNIRIKNASGTLETKLVMIVGGGYDSSQDNTTAAPNNYPLYKTDAIGNRVYIIDAYTGNPLWHAGPSADSAAEFKHASMVSAIPGDVRVIDTTADGLADRMYVGDLGGRVWRFDIHNGQLASALVKGGVFASLGNPNVAATTADNARRFYNSPDVAAVDNPIGADFLSIAIGSGYRGHPLNSRIKDRFYALRDYIPFRNMTDTEITTMNGDPIVDDDATTGADLVDVTSDPAAAIPAGSKGWKINLATGEKVLAEARTFAGMILFPTFKPSTSATSNTCKVQSGTNSLYAVNVLNGAPALDRNKNATPEVSERSGDLAQSGIAPTVVILFPTPDADCTGSNCAPAPKCLVGVESCGVSFSNAPVKTFWNQTKAD